MQIPRQAVHQEVPAWLSAALVCGTLAAILWLEKRHALRRQTANKMQRDRRNLVMAVLSATAVRCTERPVTQRLTQLVERKQWRLVKRLRLPVWIEVILSVCDNRRLLLACRRTASRGN